jgi:hypothetical protein
MAKYSIQANAHKNQAKRAKAKAKRRQTARALALIGADVMKSWQA